ncbi:hypothetical protein BH10ACI1_BH10ACI1_09260 [soil metagenome]
MNLQFFLSVILLAALVSSSAFPIFSQTNSEVFEKVELLVKNGNKVNEKNVRLHFLETELQIVDVANGNILKTFKYAEIQGAEYSYSKNPRWKTGLSLGVAAILFPPLLLIAIPLGFSKHRRHWLTVKTNEDYAVLKLSKRNRKLILPVFETKTGVSVKGEGEDK